MIFGAVALLGAACGGGDDDGEPVVPEPTLASIQENVFLPTCAQSSCHDSQDPEEGLNLSSEAAVRQTLVGADSNQVDGQRVVSGSPDDSYLVDKLRSATPEEGERMPRGFSPLSDETIDVIEEWIAAGCP